MESAMSQSGTVGRADDAFTSSQSTCIVPRRTCLLGALVNGCKQSQPGVFTRSTVRRAVAGHVDDEWLFGWVWSGLV